MKVDIICLPFDEVVTVSATAVAIAFVCRTGHNLSVGLHGDFHRLPPATQRECSCTSFRIRMDTDISCTCKKMRYMVLILIFDETLTETNVHILKMNIIHYPSMNYYLKTQKNTSSCANHKSPL